MGSDTLQLTFEQADKLCDEIVDFLRRSGGYYQQMDEYIGILQTNVLLCLATRQFILHRNEIGSITGFICWWYIKPEDITYIRSFKRPSDITSGDLMYVVECGIMGEKMAALVRDARKFVRKGVTWYNSNRERFEHYGRQQQQK